jgi:hypothetical protein
MVSTNRGRISLMLMAEGGGCTSLLALKKYLFKLVLSGSCHANWRRR